MRAGSRHRAHWTCAAVVVWVFANNGLLPAVCDYQPDGPTCPCFDDTGAWDPDGTILQDVARQTLGTRESCKCPGTASCPVPLDNGGKPYYQMVLGCANETCAEFASAGITVLGEGVLDPRDEWCSETISFWHRHAGLPYPQGYASPWWRRWKNGTTGEMKVWYSTEEGSGRGRWIEPENVTYDPDHFELGVTVPVPGAYVAIRRYDGVNNAWFSNNTLAHSLMVDEVWVHTRPGGDVFRVAVTLLEGNSGEEVVEGRYWRDVLSLTPQGSDWIGSGRKIYGFGIDLDAGGNPVYDPARLHIVEHLYAVAPEIRPVQPEDPDAPAFGKRLAATKAYADLVRPTGGPLASSSHNELQVTRLPDPVQPWTFREGLPGPVEIGVDLLDVHPLGVKGLTFVWEPGFAPTTMTVQHSRDGQQYTAATVHVLINGLPAVQGASTMVPVTFSGSAAGVPVRYIRIAFPDGAFPRTATLRDIEFRYEDGWWPDAAVDDVLPVVDIKPGSCPNPLNVTSKGVLPVAVLGGHGLVVRDIDPASVRLEGVPPVKWSYEDVLTTPDPHACSGNPWRDGVADLVLHFDSQALVGALGVLYDGDVRTLGISARLRATPTEIQGADRVVVQVPPKRR